MSLLMSEKSMPVSNWGFRILTENASRIMDFIVRDINGDGLDDIAFIDRKGASPGLSWLEQPAKVVEAPWKLRNVTKDAETAMSGAWYKGNFLSLEKASMWDVVAYRLPQGTVAWRLPLPRGTCEPRSFVIADFDKDNNDEIAIICSAARFQSTRIYLMQMTGPYEKPVVVAPSPGNWFSRTKFDVGHAIDVDGDGDLDLLTDEEVFGGNGLGVIWYENPFGRSKTEE